MSRKGYFQSFLVALICSLSSLFGQESPQPTETPTTESQLWQLEKSWNEAQVQGDADTLDHLWDDDIAVIVPKMKVINKTEALAVVRSKRVKYLKYETSDLTSHVFQDTAIVTGHLKRTRSVGDRQIEDEWRFTKVYVRRFNEWRVVLWQTSDWPPN